MIAEHGDDAFGRQIAVRHRQDPGWGTGSASDGVWEEGEHDRLTSYIYDSTSDGRLATITAPEGRLE